MKNTDIITSSIILLAETDKENTYIFGAYDDEGKATSFLKLPEDHQRFVEMLTDQQTIMGAKTLAATPADFPDGGRICVTHHPDKVNKDGIPVSDIPEGIKVAQKRAADRNQDRVFVIGGASIIRQCLDKGWLDEIELTLAYGHQSPVSNPVYLDFELEGWAIVKDSGKLISKNSKPKDLAYRYLRLKRLD